MRNIHRDLTRYQTLFADSNVTRTVLGLSIGNFLDFGFARTTVKKHGCQNRLARWFRKTFVGILRAAIFAAIVGSISLSSGGMAVHDGAAQVDVSASFSTGVSYGCYDADPLMRGEHTHGMP